MSQTRHLHINHDLCDQCGCCVAVCPEMALWIENEILQVAQNLCIHCQICFPACPTAALTLEEK